MAELVFVMPVIALIFLIMFQIYLLFDAKHSVIQATRYVTWEAMARSTSQVDTIGIEAKQLIFKLEPADYNKVKVEVKAMTSAERSSDRGSLAGFMSQLMDLIGYDYYMDPVTSIAIFLGIDSLGINLGLITAINESKDTKIRAKVEYDFDLEYLFHINELGKILKSEELNISPIKLSDGLVIIGDDWSSSSREEMARRVGVPANWDDLMDTIDNVSDGDFSDFTSGLWFYPVGGTFGAIFSSLNLIFGAMSEINDVMETAGEIFGMEIKFPGKAPKKPMDPRGDYLDLNNPPDFPS